MLHFLKVFKNRLKFLFDFKDMWNWEYETCDNCGNCFRIAYQLTNEAWNKIYGNENGGLCLECLIKLATKKGILLKLNDFDWLSIYTPELNKQMDFINKFENE